jgi:hypothetical protein
VDGQSYEKKMCMALYKQNTSPVSRQAEKSEITPKVMSLEPDVVQSVAQMMKIPLEVLPKPFCGEVQNQTPLHVPNTEVIEAAQIMRTAHSNHAVKALQGTNETDKPTVIEVFKNGCFIRMSL